MPGHFHKAAIKCIQSNKKQGEVFFFFYCAPIIPISSSGRQKEPDEHSHAHSHHMHLKYRARCLIWRPMEKEPITALSQTAGPFTTHTHSHSY